MSNPHPTYKSNVVLTNNTATLQAALAEIERLKATVDYNAKAAKDYWQQCLALRKDINRKDAALRVALEALEITECRDDHEDEYYDRAIQLVKGAL